MRDTPGKIVAGACFALALVRVMLDQFLRVHDKAPLSRVDVRTGDKSGSAAGWEPEAERSGIWNFQGGQRESRAALVVLRHSRPPLKQLPSIIPCSGTVRH